MLSIASAVAVVVFASPAVIERDTDFRFGGPPSDGVIAAATVAAPHLDAADSFSHPLSPRSSSAAWLQDRPKRPAPLPAMYVTLGGLQALDAVTTYRVVRGGGSDLNPVVQGAAGNAAAMLAVKAAATAGTNYFAERAWKKHRRGAVILMVIVNGVTAAVVANNLQKVR